MSIENGGNNENIEPPKTPEEKAIDAFIQDYLSFQSSGTKQDKLNRVHNAQNTPKIREYASALIEAGKKEGWETVKDTAARIRNAMLIDAEALKMPVSVFGKDASWALLDLGQRYQQYLQTPAPAAGEKDTRVNPFDESDEATNVRWDISDRQLSYQARRAYYGKFPQAKIWRKAVDENEQLYADALPLLRDKGNRDGQLTFAQETKLGYYLHKIAEERTEEPKNQPATSEAVTPEVTPEQSVPQQSEDPKTIEQPPVPEVATEPTPTNGDEEHVAEKIEQEADKEADTHQAEDHNHTVAREMRQSLQSLGWAPYKPERIYSDEDTKIRLMKPGPLKAGLTAVWFLPLTGLYVAGKEAVKTSWESVKGMWGVLKAFLKNPSFKAMSGVKLDTKKGDHGKDGHGHEKGHSGHGHDDHGHGDHGHDDHGHGGHGDGHKKKPWYARFWVRLTGGGGDHGHGKDKGGHGGHGGGGGHH